MIENHSHLAEGGHILKILVASEHARADALFRKDRRALESLLAPDFIEIGLFGRFSQEDILSRIFPLFTLHSLSIDDPHVQSLSNNMMELTYHCTEDATLGRNRKNGTFRVIARFSLIGNRWKISRWEIVPGIN